MTRAVLSGDPSRFGPSPSTYAVPPKTAPPPSSSSVPSSHAFGVADLALAGTLVALAAVDVHFAVQKLQQAASAYEPAQVYAAAFGPHTLKNLSLYHADVSDVLHLSASISDATHKASQAAHGAVGACQGAVTSVWSNYNAWLETSPLLCKVGITGFRRVVPCRWR